MSKNRSRRERQLRRERARLVRTGKRSSGSGPAVMRFRCEVCGAVFEQPSLMRAFAVSSFDEAGRPQLSAPQMSLMRARCPVCGQDAEAINQVTMMTEDGMVVSGFANSKEDIAKLNRAIDQLRALGPTADVEQIIDLLESQGGAAAPVAAYLRENHLELASLGVGLVALVIALLTWLLPQDAPDDPVVPSGITKNQMERLIEDFERSQTPTPSAPIPENNAESGQRDQDEPGTSVGRAEHDEP